MVSTSSFFLLFINDNSYKMMRIRYKITGSKCEEEGKNIEVFALQIIIVTHKMTNITFDTRTSKMIQKGGKVDKRWTRTKDNNNRTSERF